MTDEQTIRDAAAVTIQKMGEALDRTQAESRQLRARLAAAEKALRDALLLLGQASGSESMDRAKAILDEALHPDGAA